MPDWLQSFAGRTVAVIASGPSLTEEDCEAVRSAGLPTFVVNTSFRRALWADMLVAHDAKWWLAYGAEVDATFKGRRFRCGSAPRIVGEKPALWLLQFRAFGNSGCAAISLAALAGARRVLLLGVDCQRTGGAVHWHGDHPPELSNARLIDKWPPKFAKVAAYASGKGCEVVNCSRETALTCFRRARLVDELNCCLR